MYQSFVRGTMAKKRQSQFSERKAAREQERYRMQHQLGVDDLAKAEHARNKNSLGLAKQQQIQMNI